MKTKTKTRFLALALAIAMAAAFVPMTTASVLASDYASNGKFLAAIEPPAFGSIPISNRAELAAIGNVTLHNSSSLSGKYHLTNDIDLSDGAWIPIGSSTWYDYFSGVFDGQGYVIRNLTITGNREYAGLFGRVSSDAVIKNVGLEGANIDIQFKATVYSNPYVGGISGYGGTISNCYNKGTVSVSANYSPYLGGICGGNGTVSNCYNEGTVSATVTSNSMTPYAGGICGYNGNINNCYNMSSVSASGSNSKTYVGGICGYNSATYFISNSYNTGSIIAHSSSVSVGGICGYSADNASVRNCYWNIDSQQIANDYLSNDQKKGLGYGIGQTTALTTEQMKQQSSFSGWDFTSVWAFKPGVNDGYPVLRAFHEFPSPWAEGPVNRAVGLKLVPSQLHSKYTQPITRAEFCMLGVAIYEAYTGEAITERATFSDDRGNVDIRKMAGLGVVSGNDGKFSPDLTFNREMAAALLVNLLKAMDITLPKTPTTFSDKASMSGWAVEQIGQVQAAGLISGSDGKFNPQWSFTRESAILLMLNLWDYLNR